MVDLAKIRKKVRKQKEEEAAAALVPEAPPAAAAAPVPAPAPPKEPASAGPEPTPAAPASPPQGPPARGTAKLDRFRETAGRLPETVVPEGPSVAAEPEGALLELLTFAMAGEQYAIDIERIAEIISPRQATTVPNAPAPVVGIISLRGTIVTMLDLRRELGHGPAAAIGPETRTIVVDDSGSLAGFVVDRVLRVVKVRPAQIQAQPVVSPAEQSDAVRGVFQSGTSLTIVLDVEKLLARG